MPVRLSEDNFIELMARLSRRGGPRPILGIGDDAAVLDPPRKSHTLVTTDLLTEGVHFLRDRTPPLLLGRKAMAVNLSDIAAMGGVPLQALVAVGFPRGTSAAWARDLARGLAAQARLYRVAIVGGDTCAAERLFVNVTLLGAVEAGRAVKRSGARIGDKLYVTGTLGASAAGLVALRAGGAGGRSPRARRRSRSGRGTAGGAARRAVLAHLDPTPRVLFGRALGLSGAVTAMIDLSDGLAKDLPRLCAASGTGAVIGESVLPVDPLAVAVLGEEAGRRAAIAGGEDYELLFSAPPEAEELLAALAARMRQPLTGIGAVVPRRQGIRVLGRDGRYRPLPAPAFEHFR